MAKILIVDDDADITESMKVILENNGHQIFCAEDGKQGIAKAKEVKPGLIILDVMMPELDGFETARTIKSQEYGKNIPILMLTAIKEKMGMDFKNEAGDETWLPVDDYCDKPLKMDDLIAKVNLLLKAKK